MNISDLAEMRDDSLANSAVTAFLGALIMAQSWEMWAGPQAATKLLTLTIPDYSELVVLAIAAGLFGLSLFLATASMVTPLRRWGLRVSQLATPIMLVIVAPSFLLNWMSSSLNLPQDQWWSLVLFVGGFAMFIFLWLRSLVTLFRFSHPGSVSTPSGETELRDRNGAEFDEASGRTVRLGRLHDLRSRLRMPESRGFWVTVSTVVVVIEVALVLVLWDWLTYNESGSATIRNIGLVVAGSVAIPLAIWRAVVADRQASAAQNQTAIAQQGLLNERYQKGAEMLGSEALSVRLGGIFALQRLAEECPKQYHVQIMRLFCAFVRRPTEEKMFESRREGNREGHEPGIPQDVEAVMNAICSRPESRIALERETNFRLDLRGADLRGAQLLDANLTNAFLHHSNLSGANFANTDLTDSFLAYTDLSQAQFYNVNFSRIRLWFADLSGALLQDSDLSGVDFSNSMLHGTNFLRANMSRATFQYATVTKALLESACLSGASFLRANLTDARLMSADLNGAHFLDADLTNANLAGADLSGVEFSRGGSQAAKGLTQARLDQACADPGNPPDVSEVMDSETGNPLIWSGER
ncbi:MAG: hypothetical protein F4W95_15255 [Chloroflexi bacterium]|nr:hypothetical protein [Chloroflexota bacterium]MYD49814.1 hypothetical protein [Chloroflexota bacterium]